MRSIIDRLRPFLFYTFVAVAFLYGMYVHMEKVWFAHDFLIGDGGIDALIAKHILHGEFPLYWWGQRYYAPLHALSAAPFLWFFGDSTIAAYRMPAVLFAASLLYLLFSFVCRYWGRSAALFSLLLFATPGWYVSRYLGGTPLMRFNLVLLLLFLLFIWKPTRGGSQYARVFLSGAIIGLGVWFTPQFFLYPLLLLPVYFLSREEVQRWRSEQGGVVSTRVSAAWFLYICLFAVLSALMFSTHSLFFGWLQRWIVLGFLAFLLFATFVFITKRYKDAAMQAGVFLTGLLLGNAPQWIGYFVYGIRPEERIGIRNLGNVVNVWERVTTELFATVIGVQIVPKSLSFLQMPLIVCVYALTAYFLWHYRGAIRRLLFGYPLKNVEACALTIAGVFILPLLAALVTGLGLVGSIRMVMDAFLGYALVIGVSLALLAERLPKGMVIASVFLLLLVSASQLPQGKLQKRMAVHTKEQTEELQRYMQSHDIAGGYAPYHLVYPINFLTGESVIFAPIQRAHERRPSYREFADSQDRFAVLLRIPDGHAYSTDATSLLERLERKYARRNQEGFANQFLVRLRRSTFLDYADIGQYKVWLFSDPA